MFRDSIPGINKIFETEPNEGSVILVTGGSGTLKSSFVFSVMCAALARNHDENAIYVTLEETRESHLKNMESIGIKYNERLNIYDVASFKSDMGYEDLTSYIHPKDYIDLVLRGLFNVIRKGTTAKDRDGTVPSNKKLCCYALDSLNALQDLAKIDSAMLRQKIHELFFTLRGTKGINFVILETASSEDAPEYYLADGIIELGMQKSPAGVKRYIQVKKMKAVKHSLDPYLIDIAKGGGLTIISPLTGGR